MGQSARVLIQHCPGLSPDDPPFENRRGEGPGDEVGTYIHTYTLFRHGKNISYKIKFKIKLIYMLAVWEYEEDIWRSILFLNLVKDLMALTLGGRLFHNCAPL